VNAHAKATAPSLVLPPSGPQFTDDGRRIYRLRPGTKLAEFVSSNNFVDGIVGPLGSGKSVGLFLRLMRHAQEQKPSLIDGLRRTRWFIARNTYPDLRRTTIRTWLELFPEHLYGRFNWGQPPSHKIAFGDVRLEVDFLALDKPDDIRKLRSGEYTGGLFNEIQYIDKALFDEGQSRVDRYPSKDHGGATWSGVLFDANAPDEDHWLGMMTGMVDPPPGLTDEELADLEWPPNWGFFLQPPALIEKRDKYGRVAGYEVNPEAENLENLSANYYERQRAGKTTAWIDSRLMVRVVLVIDGSPVWPMFRREFHVANEPLEPVAGRGHDVLLWLDFGRMPGALFAQEINNRIYVQYELQGINEGATTFAPRVKRFLEQNYAGCTIRAVGDPKGRDKGQADDQTAYDVFAANDIMVSPAPVPQNNIKTRVDTVAFTLNDNPAGVPRLVISPRCRTLITGMSGRYHLKKEESGELVPSKDRYSHLCDALQYGLLGQGEGRRMVGLDPGHRKASIQTWKGRRSMRRLVG
jgi:hypothetical protein